MNPCSTCYNLCVSVSPLGVSMNELVTGLWTCQDPSSALILTPQWRAISMVM